MPPPQPILLIGIPAAFDHPDWVFELKHDRFRALAHIEGYQCALVSRRRHAYRILVGR
jgi:ATP-dependent DNA ligase